MLVEKKIHKENNEIGYIESVFDSTNILRTTYFPKQERLYISFGRGDTYSYSNVTETIYKKFEEVESQGKFFITEIKKKPNDFPFRKEFSLYPWEIEEVRKIITEKKNDDENR